MCHAGGNLLEQFKPFPTCAEFERHETGGIAARLRQAVDEAGTNRIGDAREHYWNGAGHLQQRTHGRAATCHDNVRREFNQLGDIFTKTIEIAHAPPVVDPYIAAFSPASFLQPLHEGHPTYLPFRVISGQTVHKHANTTHPLGLLRAHHNQPRRCASKPRNERPPFHWITSSAVANSVSGMARPSALAVLRLMTISYLVGA